MPALFTNAGTMPRWLATQFAVRSGSFSSQTSTIDRNWFGVPSQQSAPQGVRTVAITGLPGVFNGGNDISPDAGSGSSYDHEALWTWLFHAFVLHVSPFLVTKRRVR